MLSTLDGFRETNSHSTEFEIKLPPFSIQETEDKIKVETKTISKKKSI